MIQCYFRWQLKNVKSYMENKWKFLIPQFSCFLNLHALTPTSTTVNATSARKFGYKTESPTPFSITPRANTAKCFTGFRSVSGCIHFGIASNGVVAPDNIDKGGVTKKLIKFACCCDLVNVAMIVPIPIPESMHNIPDP